MSLSGLVHSRLAPRITGIILALAVLLVLPACWVYSVEPLYDERAHDNKSDPDLMFDQALVGAWGQMDDDCLWILTISASEEAYSQKAYSLTMAPAPECKTEGKASRYEGHLVKLNNHHFLDVAAQSSEVCDLCLPVHTFLLVSQERDNLSFTPVDFGWMTQAIKSKKVLLAHLRGEESSYRSEITTQSEAVVLTASSKELKEFARRYAEDKAVFNPDSDAKLKFKRR